VDGVDEAAQLEPYPVADRQAMQLDQGRRDVLGATQAEHQYCMYEHMYCICCLRVFSCLSSKYMKSAH